MEVLVELDDGAGEVENEARGRASLRGGNELDEARSGGGSRGRITRGPTSEVHPPEVERAGVDAVLASPVAGGQTSGVGSVETGLGVESVADLARHGEENGRRRARRHPGVVERSPLSPHSSPTSRTLAASLTPTTPSSPSLPSPCSPCSVVPRAGTTGACGREPSATPGGRDVQLTSAARAVPVCSEVPGRRTRSRAWRGRR